MPTDTILGCRQDHDKNLCRPRQGYGVRDRRPDGPLGAENQVSHVGDVGLRVRIDLGVECDELDHSPAVAPGRAEGCRQRDSGARHHTGRKIHRLAHEEPFLRFRCELQKRPDAEVVPDERPVSIGWCRVTRKPDVPVGGSSIVPRTTLLKPSVVHTLT
jgi:hypothetical protein